MDNAPIYKGFRVYPRGFLGASLGEQIKAADRPISNQLKSHTYHPGWFNAGKPPREVNRNIETMWRHMNDHHFAVDDLEFREKILRIALNAFGTQDFAEWLAIQQQGPSTGDLHMDFLADTLNFIEQGTRRLNLHTWSMMLTMSAVTHNETPSTARFAPFFLTDDKRQKNTRVIDVVQRWCAQPGGFADMAQTLHVLFGEVLGS